MNVEQLAIAVTGYTQFIERCQNRHKEQPVPYGVTCFMSCSPTDIKLNGDCRDGCPLNKAKLPQDHITDLQQQKHCNTLAAIAAHRKASPDCTCNDCLRNFSPSAQFELPF